jgi:hypothetical protein
VYAQAAFSWLDVSFGGAGVSLDAERSEWGVLVGRRQGASRRRAVGIFVGRGGNDEDD